jgi:hypothetical protein
MRRVTGVVLLIRKPRPDREPAQRSSSRTASSR